MLQALTPAQARDTIAAGARLIDVRSAEEHARERIPGAVCLPLGAAGLPAGEGPVIFHCRSGARTTTHATTLAGLAGSHDSYFLAGGLEAWRRAGMPIERNRSQPIPIMRQVQVAAGLLVLTGVILGLLSSAWFLAIAAFVGAGLTFAGVTGWCGMALLLERMPWNRRTAPA